MSITCTVCGTVNPDGTQFCEGCGVELTAQSVSSHPSPDQSATLNAAPASAISEAPATAAPETATPGELAPAAPVETPAPEAPVLEAPVLETPPLETPPLEPVTPGLPDMPLTDTPATDTANVAAPVAVPVSTPESIPASTPGTTQNNAAETSTAEAKLGIKKYGSATGEFIPLKGEKLVVGRFDASTGPVDIDLSGMGGQEHISRRHAEIYREGGVWKVRDLGSTNGVYIKRRGEASFSPRLQEPAELHGGDELAFGNLMLDFVQN